MHSPKIRSGDAVIGQVINDAGAQALAVALVNDDGTALDWLAMGGYPDFAAYQFHDSVALDQPTAATDAVRRESARGDPHGRRVPPPVPRQRQVDDRQRRCQTVVSRPLTVGGKAIGALVLAWADTQQLDTAQLAYTSAVATMIGQALVRARVYADEHARAAVLQAAVLPTSPAVIAGVDVGVCYEPADVVRQASVATWYDALESPYRRAYLAVGDVVGHGLPAVEDMAQLRQCRAGAGISWFATGTAARRPQLVYPLRQQREVRDDGCGSAGPGDGHPVLRIRRSPAALVAAGGDRDRHPPRRCARPGAGPGRACVLQRGSRRDLRRRHSRHVHRWAHRAARPGHRIRDDAGAAAARAVERGRVPSAGVSGN